MDFSSLTTMSQSNWIRCNRTPDWAKISNQSSIEIFAKLSAEMELKIVIL